MLRALVSTIGAAVVLAGCATPTRVTDQWKDPSYAAKPMTRVVVIGQRLPPASRRVVEDRFASDLGKRGVEAAPSYSIFGDRLVGDEEARAIMVSRGFDGALVLSLERIAERPRYVPGHYYGGPYSPYWGAPMYSYSPGYYVVDQLVNFEASLIDLRDGKRVWSATTTTENPSSSSDFAKSISKKVLPQLSEHGLVVE